MKYHVPWDLPRILVEGIGLDGVTVVEEVVIPPSRLLRKHWRAVLLASGHSRRHIRSIARARRLRDKVFGTTPNVHHGVWLIGSVTTRVRVPAPAAGTSLGTMRWERAQR